MKIFICLICITVFFGCTKGTVSNPPPPVNPPGQVTSITVTAPQDDFISKGIFRYDSVNNLVSSSYENISFASGSNPATDSGTNYFLVDAATNLPTGYLQVYRKYFYTEDYISEHAIYYNNQQQVTKDSVIEILGGPMDYKTVDYFTYSENAVKVERAYNGTTDITLLDSLKTQNGNLSGVAEYDVNNGILTLSSSATSTVFAGVSNPFYQPRISASLGAFYYMIGAGDFLSKGIVRFFSENITWTLDDKGRVILGNGEKGTTITYTYQPG